jgi:NAD(P)-dependent dehydrogenase (short-subunit alcohol dehydrogenase family)
VAGAGSGIGKSLLEVLSQKNYRSIGLSRRGVSASEEIISGINYKCDLRKEEEIQAIFKKIGRLDVLYITLGDGVFQSIQTLSLKEWNDHLELNLTAPFLILKTAYPYLKESSSPMVVILSSTAGKQGFPDSSAYCTTKHGIAGLAKAIREEWKPDIRVVTVYPGAVYTSIWEGREGFSPQDMIPEREFAIQMSLLMDTPASINIDEMYILPKKGIL